VIFLVSRAGFKKSFDEAHEVALFTSRVAPAEGFSFGDNPSCQQTQGAVPFVFVLNAARLVFLCFFLLCFCSLSSRALALLALLAVGRSASPTIGALLFLSAALGFTYGLGLGGQIVKDALFCLHSAHLVYAHGQPSLFHKLGGFVVDGAYLSDGFFAMFVLLGIEPVAHFVRLDLCLIEDAPEVTLGDAFDNLLFDDFEAQFA